MGESDPGLEYMRRVSEGDLQSFLTDNVEDVPSLVRLLQETLGLDLSHASCFAGVDRVEEVAAADIHRAVVSVLMERGLSSLEAYQRITSSFGSDLDSGPDRPQEAERGDEYTPSSVLDGVAYTVAESLGLPWRSVTAQKRIMGDLGASPEELLRAVEAVEEKWRVDLQGAESIARAEDLAGISVQDIVREVCSALEERGLVPAQEYGSEVDLALGRNARPRGPTAGEDMWYVQPSIPEKRVAKQALGAKRARSFWQVLGGIPNGLGALGYVLFPITYPIYLRLNKPATLRSLVLGLWPFYRVRIQVLGTTMQEFDVCVEGISKGLGSTFHRRADGATTEDPYTDSGEALGIDKFSSEPPRAGVVPMVSVPCTLAPSEAADYLAEGAEDAARGEKSFPAIRFRGALGLSGEDVLRVREFEVKDVSPFCYPLYVLTLTRGTGTMCLSIPAVKGCDFEWSNLTVPIMTNPLLAGLRRTDPDLEQLLKAI